MRTEAPTRGLPAAIASASDHGTNFAGLCAALWHKKFWVLGPTLVVAIFATIIVGILPPQFKSKTRIVYEGRESIFPRPDVEQMGDRDRALLEQEVITSQVRLILSRDLARIVIEEFKLGDKPEFDPALRGVPLYMSLLALFGIANDAPHVGVLDSFVDRLNAYQVGRSRIIAVEFQSVDPELAAQVANAVTATYLGLQQAATKDSTRGADLEELKQRPAAPADARIVSRARAASAPDFPKKLPIVLMATLAMLALSAGLIVSRELLLSSLIIPEQTLEPQAANEREEIARASVSRETAFDRAIRALAEQLRRSGEQERRIVIIGMNGESPSASTAIALARWLARSGRTMLADLAKTNEVARLAHIGDGPGMRELIGGASSFGAVMMRDRHSGAHVIVGGQSWGDDSELIASDRLMLALSALQRTYHVVLVHAGPLGENASRLARLAPRVVLVTPFTTTELIDDARTQLIQSGCRDVLVFQQPPPAEMDQQNAA